MLEPVDTKIEDGAVGNHSLTLSNEQITIDRIECCNMS